MSGIAEEGTAHLSLGENNFLTEQNGHAVVGLGSQTKWLIRAYDNSPLFMIIMKVEGAEERCLTLDTNAGGNENNIMVQPAETPRPKTSQLWTFEEPMMTKGLPPTLIARIQSAARPWLSAAIGGPVPLPVLYQNIAGVPNEPESESQRWNISYMVVE